MEKEKTLDELRAVIEADPEHIAKAAEMATTPGSVSPQTKEASTETTSTETTADNPTVVTSKEDEWVVPGKAKTKEDLVKLYTDAESYIGKQGSEISKLRSLVNEASRKGESVDEKNARLKRFADELITDPERVLEGRMEKVVDARLRKIEEASKVSEFQRTYMERKKDAEFVELEPVMVDIAKEFGDMLTPEMASNPKIFDILFMAAKGRNAVAIAQKAEAEGVKKGEDIARQKKKAAVEGPSGTSKPKKHDISKMTSSEMKAAILNGELDIKE